MEILSRNIKKLLEHNIGVDKNSTYLFKSIKSGYTIYGFDVNGNLEVELFFQTDIDSAVNKFLEIIEGNDA